MKTIKNETRQNDVRNVLAAKVAPVTAAAMVLANLAMPAAIAGATSKEEVVYVNMNASGKVEDIDVVNIFSLENAGIIEDFGQYSSVRNMTTTDKVVLKDGKITVDVNQAGKIYYDGKLISAQAPWNLSVKYYLDGKEKSASEIAGASGKLKITLKVTKNSAYAGPDFFSNYALQGTLQLDTEKCENIIAEGATMANVGQKKQLSYIALPGDGLDIEITTDVKDFEMDGFSINGIPLNLSVDIDDTELTAKVRELKDAVAKLDDGTGELNSGIKMLSDGVDEINNNLIYLDSYSDEIAKGSNDVLAALKLIQSKLPDVDAMAGQIAKLKAGAASAKDGIDKLADGASAAASGYTYDSYVAKMKAAFVAGGYGTAEQFDGWAQTAMGQYILGFNQQYFNSTDENAPGISTTLKSLAAGATNLKSGYVELYGGINTLIDKISSLSELKNGIDQLTAKYKELNSGTDSYTDGLGKIVAGYQLLVNGMSGVTTGGNTLKNGTSEFRTETATLDTTVSDKINEIVDSIKGNANIGSFVSSNNTEVKAVQFVMNTEKIEKPAAKEEKTEEEPAKKSFWEKILDLFKW